MKIMICPVNGPRNISEFVWAGDVKSEPPADAPDVEFTTYLFLEENTAGVVHEWWVHAPTNTWFIAKRNTITDEVLETMTPDTYFTRAKGVSA